MRLPEGNATDLQQLRHSPELVCDRPERTPVRWDFSRDTVPLLRNSKVEMPESSYAMLAR